MDTSYYYRILGISEDADTREIKEAFRRKAKQWHPDINKEEGAHKKFIDINEAYMYLMDLHSNSSGISAGETTQQDYYHQWRNEQREKAREQAARRARMRFEEFRRSSVYRTTNVLSHILDYFLLLLGVFIIIAAGIGLYSQGLYLEKNGEEVLNIQGIIADILITVAGLFFIVLSWSSIKSYRKKMKNNQDDQPVY